MATLATLGDLQQDEPTRKYRLGPRVLDLGFSMLGSLELHETAAPHLRRLTDATERGPRTLTSKKALLTELERVRRTGIAVNDEELESALRSIAVPVSSRSGQVVAAVNIAILWSPEAITNWSASTDRFSRTPHGRSRPGSSDNRAAMPRGSSSL
jgi:DNA-binding IclR family transcriptional regulator